MMRIALKLVTVTIPLLFTPEVKAHANISTFFDGVDNEAYVSWGQDSSYASAIFLPSSEPENGAAIHWSLDDTNIHLAVATRATGWVGFGIGENGGMRGADMVLFTAATNSISDAYVLDDLNPLVDDIQSWTLVNSQTDGGFLIFEVVRLLNSNDNQDRPIVNDTSLDIAPHRILAAWGDSEAVSYHGPTNRVRAAVRLYGDHVDNEASLFEQAMEAEAEGSIMLTAIDYPIKPIETEYPTFCFSLSDLVALGMPNGTDLHVIGMEPMVDKRAEKYVHHFVLTALEEDWGTSERSCDEFGSESMELAYTWAPGEPPLSLPLEVGGPLGLNGFKSYQLEIHYNNPTFDTNITDSSGVKLHFTSQKRQYDLGIFQVGDPFVSLYGQEVGNGLYRHSFDCPSGCSSAALQQDVFVMREYLHMHKSGIRMYNRQIRDGEVLRVGNVDFWDFAQQGTFSVQQSPFDIRPGDSFETACYYNADQKVFGLSSQDEMCIAYLYYYPKQQLYGTYTYLCGLDVGVEVCSTDWEKTKLNNTDDLARTFGTTSPVQQATDPPGTTTSGTSRFGQQTVGAWTMVFLMIAGFLSF